MSAPTIIATVPKNNLEEVRVSLISLGGFDMVDVRTFATAVGAKGEPMPTKRGICLSRDRLPDLIAALLAAEREVSR